MLTLPPSVRVFLCLAPADMRRSLDGLAALTREILREAGIPYETKTDVLTDAEVTAIRNIIDRDHKVEGDLRRDVSMSIKRLMDVGTYRGLRHRKGLPSRGQRTHTNARTRKGPRRAIAGKKK